MTMAKRHRDTRAEINYDTMAELMGTMDFAMKMLSLEMSIFQVNEAYIRGKPMRFLCEECGDWSGDIAGEELFEVGTPYTCPSCEGKCEPD